MTNKACRAGGQRAQSSDANRPVVRARVERRRSYGRRRSGEESRDSRKRIGTRRWRKRGRTAASDGQAERRQWRRGWEKEAACSARKGRIEACRAAFWVRERAAREERARAATATGVRLDVNRARTRQQSRGTRRTVRTVPCVALFFLKPFLISPSPPRRAGLVIDDKTKQ